MKIINLRIYCGEYLYGRDDGERAFEALLRDFQALPNESFFFDFSEVRMLAPSFADEVFGELALKFPERLFLDSKISLGLKPSLDVIEETRDVKFNYIQKPT
jgi:hypothetical protein